MQPTCKAITGTGFYCGNTLPCPYHQSKRRDPHADAMCDRTATKFQTLAALRGIQAAIAWDGEQYTANGTPCGPSVHGLYDWLNAQPGVKL